MRWEGMTVCCIASGPSLRAEDCLAVQHARLPAIAVNSSWKLARFCDVIYAGDAAWWEFYGAEIDIPAERWSCSRHAERYGAMHHKAKGGAYNSGMRAIEFAIEAGAVRVLLLGYDCSVSSGTHWHGDHSKTKNPDGSRCNEWARQFSRMHLGGVEVINCSRSTALTCFPRMSLEKAICSFAG